MDEQPHWLSEGLKSFLDDPHAAVEDPHQGEIVNLASTLSGVDRGWKVDAAGRHRSRRVVVKARVVKLGAVRGRGGRKTVDSSARRSTLALSPARWRDADRQKGRGYSSFEDEVDGKALLKGGREDRHQFRFIVAPEDGLELGDLKRFTRELMVQRENDIGTRLDWIAVDHHNAGHPHTHVPVRGVTDEGRSLTIAGDYIAHGIRHKASDIVTRELGPRSEIELQQQLSSEVGAERLTRLDRLLIQEQAREGFVDLFTSGNRLIRENRDVLIEALRRAGHVERLHGEHWTIPKDLPERGLAYDRSLTGEGPGIKIASQLSLDRQIGAAGASWLDREFVAPTPRSPDGFGRDVTLALEQRRDTLVDMGLATRSPRGGIEAPGLINRLQRREVERVATDLAKPGIQTFLSRPARLDGRVKSGHEAIGVALPSDPPPQATPCRSPSTRLPC